MPADRCCCCSGDVRARHDVPRGGEQRHGGRLRRQELLQVSQLEGPVGEEQGLNFSCFRAGPVQPGALLVDLQVLWPRQRPHPERWGLVPVGRSTAGVLTFLVCLQAASPSGSVRSARSRRASRRRWLRAPRTRPSPTRSLPCRGRKCWPRSARRRRSWTPVAPRASTLGSRYAR
jgi:hypothetical protein